MSVDTWIHIAELVFVVLLTPLTRSGINVLISLRDAVKELTFTMQNVSRQVTDHEARLRWVEQSGERRSGVDRRSNDAVV